MVLRSFVAFVGRAEVPLPSRGKGNRLIFRVAGIS
jgi:hypothetical protein